MAGGESVGGEWQEMRPVWVVTTFVLHGGDGSPWCNVPSRQKELGPGARREPCRPRRGWALERGSGQGAGGRNRAVGLGLEY